MKKVLFALCLGSWVAGGIGAAIADDSNSNRPVLTYKQKMKMCMDREREHGSNASDSDLKKTCADKIQSYEQHPSETKTPPSNPTT